LTSPFTGGSIAVFMGSVWRGGGVGLRLLAAAIVVASLTFATGASARSASHLHRRDMPVRATVTALVCGAGTLSVGQSTSCTATVTDVSPGGATAPQGMVSFTGRSSDSFTSSPCALVSDAATTASSSCAVSLIPTAGGKRPHVITARYARQLGHAASRASAAITVTAPVPDLNGEDFDTGPTGGTTTITDSGACGDPRHVLHFTAAGPAFGMYAPNFTVDGDIKIVDNSIASLRASFTTAGVRGVMTLADPAGTSFSCEPEPPADSVSATLDYSARIATSSGLRHDTGTVALNFSKCLGPCNFFDATFSSSRPPDPPVFDFPDFASTAGLSLNGSASQQTGAGIVQLTGGLPGQVGSVWSETLVSPERSFETTFDATASESGFAFVVQGDPAGAAALGAAGSPFGSGGITPSVAVAYDPYDDLVAVYENGSLVQSYSTYFEPANTYRIDYNAFIHQLNISDNQSTEQSDMMSVPLDLPSVLAGPAPALVGFTAAAQSGDSGPSTLQDWQLTAPADSP
jgi:hypothetical protein